jgi:hypothetical protein
MRSRPSSAHAGALGLALGLLALGASPFVACSSSDTEINPLPIHAGAGGGSTSSATSSTATATSTTASSTSTGMAPTWSACDACLTTTCVAEEAACDGECLAVQACIETVCPHLSATASLEEGQCQKKCQDEHPDGASSHLALVNCADHAVCSPPCTFYPQDNDLCRSFMTKGACKDVNQACKDSLDCQNYKDCVSTCKTLAECIACDNTPAGTAGRKALEAYELCVAGECTAEAWLP